uniref:NFATC2-interacting protein n=1 Tax=Rhipicephalus zambeziensis TaxID=60191 RepID=A0A224YNU7_9ACAR
MPRKRKIPPPNKPVEFKQEVQSENQKEQFFDIGNTRKLFGSNIFSRDAILAVENRLKQSPGSQSTALASKCTPKTKCVTEKPAEADDECIVLSQGSTTSTTSEKSLRRSPRKRIKQLMPSSPVVPSKETSQILQRLEMLERVTCQDIILSDEDSTDSLVCLDESPVSLPQEDDDLILMVQCQSRMLKYSIPQDKPFAEILEKLAEECGVETCQVMLLAKEQPVQPEDTPQSLALSSADILDCIIRKYAGPSGKAANNITLRFQCANKRSTESIEVALDEPLQKGAKMFAEKVGLPFSKLVYKFDGEKVQLHSTPEELGIEDGDCVDVSIRP